MNHAIIDYADMSISANEPFLVPGLSLYLEPPLNCLGESSNYKYLLSNAIADDAFPTLEQH